MADWFASLDGREKAQLFNAFRTKAKDKSGGTHRDAEEEKVVFELMSGDPTGKYVGFRDFYDNLYLPAWKAFAPKYASKTPCPSSRALMPFRKAYAEAFQALFRYRVGAFDYRALISAAAMDVWATKLGIGYVRHQWDEQKGLTTTSRIAPRDVYWESTANSTAKATHVIERHVVKRGEFIKKFGKKLGQEVEASKDSAVDWPGKKRDDKTLLDEIEYFLMWSRLGGEKRCYAFHENDKHAILNGDDGEPWPIPLGEDDWHLTDLRLTQIPGKIYGISPIWAAEGQHNAYQRLNGAAYFSNLKAGKKFAFFPDRLLGLMEKIESATKTICPIAYNPDDLGNAKIDDVIALWEFKEVPATLLEARAEALAKWKATINLNAAEQMDAQNVQTATEAQTLQSSAANLVADDQGAVENFTTEIFRKEAVCDASKMPTRSVVCVSVKGYEDAEDDSEPEGEFEDDSAGQDGPGEHYLHDVPYEDAIKLETGPARPDAAQRIVAARRKKAGQAEFKATAAGAPPDEVDAARQQAADAIPQPPEMAVRAQYQVPMDAECRIVNPGVEQFIGPDAAQGWVEGLTPRQIAAELGVSIEPGSSSPTQRMQNVNEVLMLLNAEAPLLMQIGQYDVLAKLLTAAIRKSEIADLDDVEVTGDAVQQYLQQQQQAQAQQAQAEAAAKGQPQGPVPEDPNVMAKSQSEVEKAQIAHASTVEKTKQIELKNQGDAARDRTRALSQLQLGGMPRP